MEGVHEFLEGVGLAIHIDSQIAEDPVTKVPALLPVQTTEFDLAAMLLRNPRLRTAAGDDDLGSAAAQLLEKGHQVRAVFFIHGGSHARLRQPGDGFEVVPHDHEFVLAQDLGEFVDLLIHRE